MASQTRNRSRLLLGCGGAAIAAALAASPETALAQAIQASPAVVEGSATITSPTTGLDVISAETDTVVIDWTPFEDGQGNALDFLPTGTTAIFQNDLSQNVTQFAVLNRILPSTNGNIAVIDGSVISQIDAGNGFNTGGFVAFYSPTGLLIGSNAVFDVGGLMLTTLDPNTASFQNFPTGSSLNLFGNTGSQAGVFVSPGAQINAPNEGSFFIAAGAEVQVLGDVAVNGSHAYVAGEIVSLTLNNGLFDIEVLLGTAASGTVMDLDGNIGGPSSTGVGDNHVIYAVAKAQSDPIAMFFSGNLGFDPAVSAGIDNGDIILSANHDVFGRSVAGGSIDDGVNATFNTSTDIVGAADILVAGITVTGDLLAVSSDSTQITTSIGNSSFSDDVLAVGGTQATITAINGQTLTIGDDALAFSTNYGRVTEGGFTPGELDATGGFARISADGTGSTVIINGMARASADGIAGFDQGTGDVGSADGGVALIGADGGTITIGASAIITAIATAPIGTYFAGGSFTGGRAQYFTTLGGTASVGGDLAIFADAQGADVSLGTSGGTAATGGQAFFNSFNGGGTMSVGGFVTMSADGVAGTGSSVGAGATGTGGTTTLIAEVPGVSITIGNSVDLSAEGRGAINLSGTGGEGIGGRSRLSNFGGTIDVTGGVLTVANGTGGDGVAGGIGRGGIGGVFVGTGTTEIGGGVDAQAVGIGGNASFGHGGAGGAGFGGNAFVQAEGTLTQDGALNIAGDLVVAANAFGGVGGSSDGSSTAAGAGGEARAGEFSSPNPADPAFSNGAFALAQGDRGTLTVGGTAAVASIGFGGAGGSGAGAFDGGNGGDGYGGLAQAGLFQGTGNGSVGQGVASFGDLTLFGDGFGGNGGIESGGDAPSGTGGDGFGGDAFFGVRFGEATVGELLAGANGIGGDGSIGGNGTGGGAGIVTTAGGIATFAAIGAGSSGIGGEGFDGDGGDGFGGESFIGFQGGTANIAGNANISATGIGGDATNGNGGNGTGGLADIASFVAQTGNATIGGTATVTANGLGGDVNSAGFTGGDGTGGEAYLLTQAGSTLQINVAQVLASGRGGSGASANGGDGTGGLAYIASRDAGSSITIQSAPSTAVDLLDQGSLVGANGIGGDTTGGAGIGGTGEGGTALVTATTDGSVALPQTGGFLGTVRVFARGQGGGSSVEGGRGGLAIGGSGSIEALDGGTLTAGPVQLSTFSQGGSSLDTDANIDGGDATAGERYIVVTNGATLTASFPSGVAGASGGNGSGTGNGGNASGGIANLEVIGGTANLIGSVIVPVQNVGGNGLNGGSAIGGLANLLVEDGGVVNILEGPSGPGQLLIGNLAVGGNATSGTGGSATAQFTTVAVSDSTINGDGLLLQAVAVGGQSNTGTGGAAQGGLLAASISGSTIDLVSVQALANANGGVSQTLGHGDAQGGDVVVGFTDSTVVVANLFNVHAKATTGTSSTTTAVGGTATAGSATLSVGAGTQLIGGGADVAADAFSFNRGNAQGGNASFLVDGGSAQLASLIVQADASAAGGGFSNGGAVSMLAVNEGSATIDTAFLNADGEGAEEFTGGEALLSASTDGSFTIRDLDVSAVGADDTGEIALSAQGGNILISDAAFIRGTGSIDILTASGGLIGGPTVSDPTANIIVSTTGTITIDGDDDESISFGGNTLTLESSDLDVLAGARFGANNVAIISLDEIHTAIIGGDTEGSGFTLTAAEAARIEAGTVEVFMPSIGQSSSSSQPDVIVRDLTISGTEDDGVSAVRLASSGTIRVEGVIEYINAGATDVLTLDAQQIQVITPGGIGMVDSDGDLSGVLELRATDIWVGDAEIISQLAADQNFEGRNEALMTATQGSDDPLGYLRAGGIEIAVADSLFVQNTGTESEPGGILVGSGGLSIKALNQEGLPTISVFAYGRQETPTGGFILGEEFFRLINFNQDPGNEQEPTEYFEGSAFNDCDITSGECATRGIGSLPEEVVQDLAPIANPAVIDAQVETIEAIPASEDEANAEFGLGFPGLVDAPLMSEDTVLDDPVASGGDSALYAVDDDDDGDDDDEDEDEGEE